MTSGRGIMHEEMPKPVNGKMEGFQLWVNLPAKLKMSPPRYQEIAADQVPEVVQGGNRVRVIAGAVEVVSGPVTDIAADPTYLDVLVAPHMSFLQPISRGHNAFAYVFEGEGLFGRGSTLIPSPRLVILSDGDYIEVRTNDQAVRFLLISGKPLHEPIARYGPFVMNTREEIEQALRDLQKGVFVTP
jgi:hypothetical protein